MIARSEILEFFEAKSSQDDIGGLNVLKVWLNQRYRAFSKEARDYGLPIPKGVLLISYSSERKEQGNRLPQNQFPRVGQCRYSG